MVGNHQKIYELAQIEEQEIKEGTAKDSERNQRKNSKGVGGRMERRTGEKLLRDIQKIQKRNERGGLQRKSRVNGFIGVVESENKQFKSRRSLLAEKQGDVCGMQ